MSPKLRSVRKEILVGAVSVVGTAASMAVAGWYTIGSEVSAIKTDLIAKTQRDDLQDRRIDALEQGIESAFEAVKGSIHSIDITLGRMDERLKALQEARR